AAAAAARLGRPIFAMPGGALPAQPAEMAALARAWRRDLVLTGGILLLEAEGGEPRTLSAFAEAMNGALLIAAPEPVALPARRALRLDMARPRAADQLHAWGAALAPFAARLNGTLPRLAVQFQVAPERMQAVAAELATAPADAALDELAWAACRRHARPRLDDLASRVEGRAGWDDIVLPPAQLRALRTIAAHLRHRARVQEDWGFGAAPGGRGLGLAALFSGPSGAGKTMAAEVLGGALGLDVYRVDLSALVSKWIGETEKNLRRIFDAAEEGSVILLFDEADALFGKRSEVRDSHDRYANMEVSYLLQRLEAYRGLAILTTNLRANLDEAFLRRFRFAVEFPFPAATERAGIWARAFPRDCPTEGLEMARLAQLNVVGGAIRNIAMNAAYIAAEHARPVGMAEVLAAARLEYEKAGRAMTDPELRGWPQ
ncbi:ATP-binding protein, partial [Falsiroseomonas sp.]|uniref:ATP-binding protein n=1 Tax=Falsiroseomonas sp. TaxID=2870721 RepID=UPI002718FA2B